MPDARLDLILHQLDELPTLPAVAVRVLDATGRDDTEANDVTRLLESDPALSARILKLVHRADLAARGGNAETVARAVALLGFDAVRCATLAVAVYQTLGGTADLGRRLSPTHPDHTPFDRAAFWTHSLAVACCADLLATRLPVRDVAPATGVPVPACCTTWARPLWTRRCPRVSPGSSKPSTCSAATSPTSSGP